MKSKILSGIILPAILLSALSCEQPASRSSHEEMIVLLKEVNEKSYNRLNTFSPPAKLAYIDSLLNLPNQTEQDTKFHKYQKGNILLELGMEEEAIKLFESVASLDVNYKIPVVWKDLALAYLRQGERSNCITNHAAESCILPIRGVGLHRDMSGSKKAIEIYTKLLALDPQDVESKWLINIAYMTLGEYPNGVPANFLLPEMGGDTTIKINSFDDVASDLKLNLNDMAGGVIIDDFDNDGYLDMVTSCMDLDKEMHYFKNNSDGTFSDLTDKANLRKITGGLNIMQADYNNDGYKDILVLRGGWREEYGREPNSLLRNNGDGSFTDVTTISGLLSFHPTQTATWNDFNNDGWLDLFIGNESSNSAKPHPCEFYINNKNGTFTEIAQKAQCKIVDFVKAVGSGDYDNDGRKDIIISAMSGKRILLKNTGKGDEIKFEDVSIKAGLKEYSRSFPTWFWDYNNDGWLDIFVCDYTFEKSLAYYAAVEKLNYIAGNPDKMLLYRNNHDGTFTNVAREAGLNKTVFSMGSNYGDIDNDGYLDMYLGSGNPRYQSLVPNKMFKNIGGEKFADVTNSARVGHLQKGHGVSFGDLDNDGDQDVYIEMGGAFVGDAYQNSFFLNPGQGSNNWICVTLEGKESNRAAIGSRVKLTFKENGISRSVYRDVNSGGSFGASPLRREIGIGQATEIDEMEIHWHGSGKVEVFKNIKPNQFIKITEGSNKIENVNLKTINWSLPEKLCAPIALVK